MTELFDRPASFRLLPESRLIAVTKPPPAMRPTDVVSHKSDLTYQTAYLTPDDALRLVEFLRLHEEGVNAAAAWHAARKRAALAALTMQAGLS
jgi:hypothetical protein